MNSDHVTRYGPGEGAPHNGTTPGDFILTHRTGPASWLIDHGQNFQFKGEERIYAHWTHAALVTGTNGELVEAWWTGVRRANLSEYLDVEYHYVSTGMNPEDRRQATAFAEACVGQDYGWLEIGSLTVLVGTKSRLILGLDGTEFCSALVARSLERGSFIFPKAPVTMMPGHLAKYCNVKP